MFRISGRFGAVLVFPLLCAISGCGGGNVAGNGDASARGGGGGTIGGGGTTGGGGGAGSGGAQVGAGGAGGNAGGQTGGGGAGGVAMCVPGVQQIVITDCGYPYVSNNPLTNVAFTEAEVLRAIEPAGTWPNGIVRLFYNDEHALTLGVRSVTVKTSSGTTTTDYPVSPMASNPGGVVSPQMGTTELAGDQSGLDASLRPMWPSLFITDVTADPTSRAGDWQQGGTPRAPDAIFGSWKAAVRMVNRTVTPATSTITPDADPTKNNWNLGSGDPAPAGLSNEGFGAEVKWNVPLAPGRSYRVQVLVHDGDQNKAGGDSGEACVLFCAGGSCGSEGCDTGGVGGSTGSSCPPASAACGPGGIDPASCPSGTACANGCCLTIIP
jgi:hypothetical protein